MTVRDECNDRKSEDERELQPFYLNVLQVEILISRLNIDER